MAQLDALSGTNIKQQVSGEAIRSVSDATMAGYLDLSDPECSVIVGS